MQLRSVAGPAVVAVALATMAAACGAAPAASGSGGDHLAVVAAENFWGSIAAQLGGTKVTVRSIVANPETDPHSYEPTPTDAIAVAEARMVVYNGVGYDPWVQKLLGADPERGRVELDVGAVVGVRPGANPHRWYSPTDVGRVIDAITAGYRHALPKEATYFDQRRAHFVSSGLARYRSLLAAVRARYAGTPVGASESVFVPMAEALGLRVLTPASFLDAVSEGAEPTAGAKAESDSQIRRRSIRVYVFNRQNSTPDVQAEVHEAQAAGVPVTAVTETLVPAAATFQAWQVGQLEDLQAALARATGR
ncbi:MAG TPA: zinc ABC transporter substrate-binding protein [Acidimicrobiales bacterium]|nr:zinc ABC transporter substrate-binding protein [Acidimicrobiales bacterium]